jgi:hypothetical protein
MAAAAGDPLASRALTGAVEEVDLAEDGDDPRREDVDG